MTGHRLKSGLSAPMSTDKGLSEAIKIYLAKQSLKFAIKRLSHQHAAPAVIQIEAIVFCVWTT